MSNEGLSYLVGVTAQEEQPSRWLSGDRNISPNPNTPTPATPPLIQNTQLIGNTSQSGWTSEIHQDNGNMGLADGSVQQYSSAALRESAQSGQETYGRQNNTNPWFIGLPNQ